MPYHSTRPLQQTTVAWRLNGFMKLDGFILDFTEVYLRPVLGIAMEAKLLYMQEEQLHFTHSTYRNPAEAKLFCLKLVLCTQATQPALEKCICITWSQLLNCVSNPPPHLRETVPVCDLGEDTIQKSTFLLFCITVFVMFVIYYLWSHATIFDIYILKVLGTLNT